MSSSEKKALILKNLKLRFRSREWNSIKKYDSKEVYELIHVANCFPELREKK